MPADMASAAAHAFWLLIEPARLMVLVIGVVIGLAIGVLPGLNGLTPGLRSELSNVELQEEEGGSAGSDGGGKGTQS